MLNFNFNRLAKAASIAALTLGVASAALPVQKASAQLTGAGASSVIPVADQILRPAGDRYIVTGSGAGRAAFTAGSVTTANGTVIPIDFISSDGNANISDENVPNSYNPQVPGQVAVNAFNLAVAFPYNVPTFNGQLSVSQACDIIGGNVTNWNQVGGPNLAIRRVARGDNSGTTTAINNGFIVPFCGGNPGPIQNPPIDSSGNSTLPNARLAGSVDPISGQDDSDIIVPPALPDPFTAAENSGDDNNSNSYSLGVANIVTATPGAVGYDELGVAQAQGLPVLNLSGVTFVNGGPNFFIFRGTYEDPAKAEAARVHCRLLFNVLPGYLPPSNNVAIPTTPDACDAIQG